MTASAADGPRAVLMPVADTFTRRVAIRPVNA